MLARFPLAFNLGLISCTLSRSLHSPGIWNISLLSYRFVFCSSPLSVNISSCPHHKPLQYAPDKVQKILVGNKSDEVDKRQVATEQGIKVGHSGIDGYVYLAELEFDFVALLCCLDTWDYSGERD